MMPVRFQLSRRKGWKMPPGTVNVARPGKYGNPHRVGFCPVCGVEHTREEAIAEFRAEIEASPEWQARIREQLAGKNVACWCHLNEACHGDVLVEVANAKPSGGLPSAPANGSAVLQGDTL
jgi:hypothetical protein